MINTNQFEKLFFLFSLENPTFLNSTNKGFFSLPEIELLSTVAKTYYNKYKKTPSSEQLWMIISTKSLESKCSRVFFDEVFKKSLDSYDRDWIEQTAISWIKWKHLDSSIIDTVEYLQNQKVTPENVTDIIETVKDIILKRNNISFDSDLGTDFFNPLNHIAKAEDLVSSNWDFLDKSIKGYTKGTLNAYVAPPNTGKSLFMANDAANYVCAGKNVLFVSLEMGAQKIIKRIGSNMFNIDINVYDEKSKDTDFMQQKIKSFIDSNLFKPGTLTIKNYPTSTATVDDLDTFIGKIEEINDIRYDVVIIDYINILKDRRNPNTENLYIKIKNICEDLRALAQRRNIVLISATQGNKNTMNSSDIKMGDIAESSGLSATCDNVLAIIQTPDMLLEKLYWLKPLKIRDGGGKNQRVRIDVDYKYMRLRETNTIMLDTDI